MTTILDIGIRLPGLLEMTDFVLQGLPRLEAETVVADLWTFLTDATEWADTLSAHLLDPAYNPEPIENFTRFHGLVVDTHPFDTGYRFSTPLFAYAHHTLWLSQAFALSALLSLLAAAPALAKPGDFPCLSRTLGAKVSDLCHMLPHFCEPAAGSLGTFATFFVLRFAKRFFERQQKEEEMDWCKRVLGKIYDQGIAPPPENVGAGAPMPTPAPGTFAQSIVAMDQGMGEKTASQGSGVGSSFGSGTAAGSAAGSEGQRSG